MEGTKRYKKDFRRYENLEGWEKRTISDQLHTWAEKYGEKIAVTAADGEISYKGLERRASEIAGAFLDLGIQKGDKVKVTLRFRGREMAHVQKTKQILDVFAEKLSDIAVVEKAPKLEGRQMMMFLTEKRQ